VIAVTRRHVPALVLVVAVALLVGSVGFAVAATNGGGWRMHANAFSMMGSGGKSEAWYRQGSGPVADIPAARARAQQFADRLGLTTAEVMQFSNNFYVRLDDKTSHGATEVLVDPKTGDVSLEYGPAMMWNTRYGMMSGSSRAGMMGGNSTGMMGDGSTGMMGGNSSSGMMGGGMGAGNGMMGSYGGDPNWTPPTNGTSGHVTATQARKIANRWLAGKDKALTAGEPDAMPGYFTMETLRNGKVDGMLSVNASTGALWYHWWHGQFVAMEA
jgi:hypothetical protein